MGVAHSAVGRLADSAGGITAPAVIPSAPNRTPGIGHGCNSCIDAGSIAR